MWFFLALVVFVLSSGFGKSQRELVLIQTEDDSQDGVVDVTTDEGTNDSEDLEVFQPTSEWQAILPGQGIPAGLHVRMNLQTGKKEAKLMDGDDGSRYQKTKDAKQKFIAIDKNLISKQHLKEALKDFRDKFHDEDPQAENSDELQNRVNATKTFKSMEEIRKELEGIDIFLKKDIEIITEHVQVLNSSSSSVEEKEHALDELEYYVHQIDNARDLHSIGGLSLVIKLMNSSEESLRTRACFVLGSATQSNPHVQQAVMDQGALPLLLLLLSKEEPMPVRKKAMYALSALIRSFPVGQQAFLKLNGLGIFQTLCEEPGSGALAVKVITLMTDLLTEQIDVVRTRVEKQGQNFTDDVSGKVPLLRRMVERGWCKLVPSLLRTTENDIREKVLQALHVMVTGCKSDFKQPDVHNRLNRLKTEWLHDASRLDVDESEYVVMLLQLVADLMSKLT